MADMKPFRNGAAGAEAGRTGRTGPGRSGGRRRTGKRNRLRWIILGVIAIAFGYLYVGGSYGWYNMWKLREQRAGLQAELKELESRNRDLTGELELLGGDAEADERTRFELERLAREEHGMAREDELIYRFPEEEEDTTEVKPSDPAP